MTHQNTQVVQEVFDRLQASCEAHIAEAAALQALASGRTSGSLSPPRRRLIEAVAREFGDFPGGSSPARIFHPAMPQQSPGEWGAATGAMLLKIGQRTAYISAA